MMTSHTKKFMNEYEVAKYLGVSVAWLKQIRLYQHRRLGLGAPPHYRIGRSIRYELHEIEKWMEQFKRGGGSK